MGEGAREDKKSQVEISRYLFIHGTANSLSIVIETIVKCLENEHFVLSYKHDMNEQSTNIPVEILYFIFEKVFYCILLYFRKGILKVIYVKLLSILYIHLVEIELLLRNCNFFDVI